MSTLLVISITTIITLTKARRCDLNNPCEAMICQDVRRSCYMNFDVMCTCEMYDECEGPFMAQYLPRTRPAACSGGYYPPYYPPNPRPPINPSPPVNPRPPVNPPPLNPPPVNPPPANPGSLVKFKLNLIEIVALISINIMYMFRTMMNI